MLINKRHPYNPGGYEMGSLWKVSTINLNVLVDQTSIFFQWKYTLMPNEFYIYTFVYDVNGISSVTLYIRQDNVCSTFVNFSF